MGMFGCHSWDDEYDPDDDYEDTMGSRMARRDAEWSGGFPDGHRKSPNKDDGDPKMFKDD